MVVVSYLGRIILADGESLQKCFLAPIHFIHYLIFTEMYPDPLTSDLTLVRNKLHILLPGYYHEFGVLVEHPGYFCFFLEQLVYGYYVSISTQCQLPAKAMYSLSSSVLSFYPHNGSFCALNRLIILPVLTSTLPTFCD